MLLNIQKNGKAFNHLLRHILHISYKGLKFSATSLRRRCLEENSGQRNVRLWILLRVAGKTKSHLT